MIDWDRIASERWSKIQKGGKPFADAKGEGLIFNGKKHYTHIVAKNTDEPKCDGCACTLPAWELCEENCQHAL